jgi:hypothetical protein
MRRVFGLLAVIGLVAAISPATVASAMPIKDSISTTTIRCDGFASNAGLVWVYAEAVGEGSFVSLSITTSSDPEAMPDIITDSGTASFDGSRFSATFNLVFIEESENPEEPPTITPAGTASLEAVLTERGKLEDLSWDPTRFGNTWERHGLFNQALSMEGTLSIKLLDGTDVATDLNGCGATTEIRTLFLTNPNALVVGGDQRFIECRWTTDGGFVQLVALSDDFGTNLSEVVILDSDRVLVGLSAPAYSETAYGATYEVLDLASREIVGSATAETSLAPSGDRIDDREWVENMRFSLVGDVMTVDGSLSITIEGATTVLSMDDDACDATDLRVKVIEKIAQG